MKTVPLAIACAVLVLGSGCPAEPDAGPAPDAAADEPVRYSVEINSHDGITVMVDGAPLDPASGGIEVEYPDHAAALAAPLFHIETWIDDAPVDAIDIGIGACEGYCDTLAPDDDCAELLVQEEEVPATYDENGVFEGGFMGPRYWRGVGCMMCTMHDGTRFAVCV